MTDTPRPIIEDWIETVSGKKVQFMNIDPDTIDVKDIAHSLANQCRFNGHCSQFYSVAEHSVLVAMRVPDEHKLAALFHDASEAYLADIPSPVKQFLPDYAMIETGAERAIAEKYGFAYPYDPVIKQADMAQLSVEADLLLQSKGNEWTCWGDNRPAPNYKYAPACLPPQYAYNLFMAYYHKLTDGAGEEKKIILAA